MAMLPGLFPFSEGPVAKVIAPLSPNDAVPVEIVTEPLAPVGLELKYDPPASVATVISPLFSPELGLKLKCLCCDCMADMRSSVSATLST